MTDYTKLVKALRCCATMTCKGDECKYMILGCHDCFPKLHDDAADAIEALQAEVNKLVAQLANAVSPDWTTFEQQLPKCGEWIYKPKDAIEMMFTLPKCSVCGHESSDANKYCPNCGSHMVGEKDERN